MKLRMEKAIYGGAALGRAPEEEPNLAGKAVFVPLALPGELVDARIVSNKRGYVTAALQSVLETAPFRTQPGCDYYARCGGCHYQHADYPAQLEMKRSILMETLERAHVAVPGEIQTLAAEPWGYRNRIRLHVAQQPEPLLCYREAASHRDLAVDHCPVAAPVLQRAIASLTRVLQVHSAMARPLTEVELFTIADESDLLISLFTTGQSMTKQDLLLLADVLLPELPMLRGIRVFANDDRHRDVTTRPSIPTTSWGETAVDYTVGQRGYRVSAGAFFQVNRFLAPDLLEAVTAGRRGMLAWDLYAGVGLFAQALSQQFERVVAVESSPLSLADLRHNVRGGRHECISADTRRFLRAQAGRKAKEKTPELVVVDPPRAGLGSDVCTQLAEIAPPRIVYVSCDPATLARDLRALQPSGYRLAQLTLVDLFPQTFHLETVAVLERA